MMLIPALILSIVFCSIAFIVTKHNAKYILSGYNTMSEAQRATVDIDGYLGFFKQFHLFLGGSLFVLVMGINMFNSNLAGIFLGAYPLVGYIYFMLRSRRYFLQIKSQKTAAIVAVIVLIITLGGVGYLFFVGFRESRLVINGNDLEITGMYGETINLAKIREVKLVNTLPEINMRTNGFAAGDFRKGYFRTKDGKTIKLFVNKKSNPLLLLDTTEGEIYFSSDDVNPEDLLTTIKKWKEENQ